MFNVPLTARSILSIQIKLLAGPTLQEYHTHLKKVYTNLLPAWQVSKYVLSHDTQLQCVYVTIFIFILFVALNIYLDMLCHVITLPGRVYKFDQSSDSAE